jgi:YesN/AraC family two-component response regulator
MKNKHLYQPFELYVSDMEHWNERPLTYQFFEIVQILEGEGTRIVNENKFSYSKGSIFLFTPLDCRGFESFTHTRFCSIRFSEVFLEQYKNKQEKENVIQWLKQLENIFTNHNRFEELLIKHDGDCRMISMLIEHIIEEYKNKQSYYDENLQHLVKLALNIISRNVSQKEIKTPDTKSEEPLINKILVYLNKNIYFPEKLRVKHLAAQFNLSANYIGEYFKKITGDSLHCYIIQYKMNIIEQRLIYSEYSIGQIADELGFSDESHLSRHFKKHKGITAMSFRKQNKR